MKLALIWVAVTAYNLFKPYHVDDAVHLAIARWIAAHPLHPMSGNLNLGGFKGPISGMNQPPLYFYLLAIWGSLLGYGEATMHALQSLFSLAAILLFHRIAQRLVPANALWLTAMLALGPAVAVEQNLMVDVPLLSLWLLFFDALIVGADLDPSQQRRRFLVAALACSAAILVKYSTLALLPILPIVIAYERRWRLIWTCLIPFAVIIAWSAFNYFDYGHIHMAQRPVHVTRGTFDLPLRRFVALLVTLGAITPIGLIVAVRRISLLRRQGPAIYAAAIVLFLLFVMAVALEWLSGDFGDTLLSVGFLLNAAAMVFGAALPFARRLTEPRPLLPPNPADLGLLVLVLWIVGHTTFYSLFAPFMAARHVLPVLPAVLLVCALSWPARLPRADAVFGLSTTIALSLMLGWADWRFAAFFRDEAAAIRSALPSQARIWFAGGFGWVWYAERAGFQPIDWEQPQLEPGDFLATLHDADLQPLRSRMRLDLVRSESSRSENADPFCTVNGFYAVPFAEFTKGPWQVTTRCINTIDLYRVAS